MTDQSAPSPPDDEVLAAEHALGVTGIGERAEAEARRAHDRPFDNAVLAWEERLAPLADEIAPVEPSPKVWPRIEARIGARAGLLAGSRFWKAATAAALATAAACVVVVMTPKPPAPVPAPAAAPLPVLTSFIRPAEGMPGPIIAASLDRTRGELIFTPASVEMPSGKSAELWVIPMGQKPQSLGVIVAGMERRIALPAALLGPGQATSVLAVTVEQAGGSPTGDPMGPVVATGQFM